MLRELSLPSQPPLRLPCLQGCASHIRRAGIPSAPAISRSREAVARVYHEAGELVARNDVYLGGMNIGVLMSEDRRIEVVANGLPLWPGLQQSN